MQMLPEGKWHCPDCLCKHCEKVGWYRTKFGGRTKSPLLTCRLFVKKIMNLLVPSPFAASQLMFAGKARLLKGRFMQTVFRLKGYQSVLAFCTFYADHILLKSSNRSG